jgi:hypothetical protein
MRDELWFRVWIRGHVHVYAVSGFDFITISRLSFFLSKNCKNANFCTAAAFTWRCSAIALIEKKAIEFIEWEI